MQWLHSLTFAAAEVGGVSDEQQGVVEEALEHGRLHASLGQVLAAHCRPADHQRERLAHGDGLQELPVENHTIMYNWFWSQEWAYFSGWINEAMERKQNSTWFLRVSGVIYHFVNTDTQIEYWVKNWACGNNL